MSAYDIVPIPKASLVFEQAVALFEETWPHCYSNKVARADLEHCIESGIFLVALNGTVLLGMIGAQPQYGKTGWELHPLAVDVNHRFKGIGKALVEALEDAVSKAGGIVIYLGTDDEFYQTSLSEGDLFDHPLEKIKAIKNKANHPYTFYEKCGYQIVGVIPDANGFNRPDIMMAKRIAFQSA